MFPFLLKPSHVYSLSDSRLALLSIPSGSPSFAWVIHCFCRRGSRDSGWFSFVPVVFLSEKGGIDSSLKTPRICQWHKTRRVIRVFALINQSNNNKMQSLKKIGKIHSQYPGSHPPPYTTACWVSSSIFFNTSPIQGQYRPLHPSPVGSR